MSSPRSLLAFGLVSVGVLSFFADGCSSPKRGGDPGTAGTTGLAGSGPGVGGTGPGVAGNVGGPGGEIVLVGTGGMGNDSGPGGSNPAGLAGSTGAAGDSTGAAGNPPVKMACTASADPLPYTAGYVPDSTLQAKAMTTAMGMTDAERAQQMSGLPQTGTMANYNVFRQEDNTTKGIRAFYYRDGPRGVNLAANYDNKADYATAFPVAIARGAAFDDKLENDIGKAIGDEMVASGNTMMLAPTINILRHPAWGRAQETYGEDVFLLGRLGSAFVDGVQQYAGTSAKHYAANNIENGRETANATIDEQTLREVYARHFEMVIREGGASSIMASYNLVNTLHATNNQHLLNDILRTDFGFKGFVLSDWWAMPNGSQLPYPSASTLQPTAQQAVKAGLDMELPWRYNYSTLPSLVSGNQLAASDLITATARILEQKYRFNADKSTGFYKKAPFSTYDTNSSIANNNASNPAIGKSHIDLAQQAAEEGMVLLKNTNNVLPLKKTSGTKIAVLGANVQYVVQDTTSQDMCSSNMRALNCTIDFTTNIRTGDLGSSRVFSDPAKGTGPYAGIQAAAGSGVTVTRATAATAAAGVDAVVVIAGMTPEDEGEEYTGAGDRTSATAPGGGSLPSSHNVNLALDPKRNTGVQEKLITDAVAMAGGKPVIVVLEAGSIVDMSKWFDKVQAVIQAWYPGMAGGKAIGRVLFGDVAPSGKLPITWDANLAHWPTFAESSGNTTMGYYLGYRYFDKNGTTLSPATGSFPFGYGLSYTTFTYRNLQVPCATATKDANVMLSVEVYNDNPSVAADETVFVFVQFPGSAVTTRQPPGYKELKAYYRVKLAAGQAGKLVNIPVRVKDLKYWDTASSSWKWETGKQVKVIVAPNADPTVINTPCSSTMTHNCSLSDTFTLN
jgi:beta-glucosidase